MIVLKGHKQPVRRLAFTPDGAALLSVDRSDGVRVWDAPGGTLRWADDHAFLTSVAVTPDGRHVFTYDREGTAPADVNGNPRTEFDRENPAQLREIATGKPQAVPIRTGRAVGPHDLVFSPDGNRCVARMGLYSPHLHWWAYPSWEPLTSWTDVVPDEYACFRAMAFSADGRILAGMNANGVQVFDALTGERTGDHPFPTVQEECRLAFHPDGRRLAVGSGTRMSVFDVQTWAEVGTVRQAKKYVLDAAFTRDGRFLATVSNEATVKFWDAESWGVAAEFAWDVGGLRCLALSPDGLTAAAGGMGRKVVLWDIDL